MLRENALQLFYTVTWNDRIYSWLVLLARVKQTNKRNKPVDELARAPLSFKWLLLSVDVASNDIRPV